MDNRDFQYDMVPLWFSVMYREVIILSSQFHNSAVYREDDNCRILTKLQISPLERWRGARIPVWTHVDDSFGCLKVKEETCGENRIVRSECQH